MSPTVLGAMRNEYPKAKEKWTHLRNNFSKVLALRRAKAPSGSSACGSVKSWIYEADMEFLKRHISHSRAMSSSIRTVDRPTASPTLSTSLESETQAEDYPPQQESIQPEENRIEWKRGTKKTSKSPDEVDKAVLACMQTLNNQALHN
ncbi:hypothetical protein PoB_003704800 [Plakobranchus ocellatus]|uniref:MADF domain-containing protein n=1 Tax=Plakobranchus ocellatus TaxID=259542 RepID=A0AAV4AVG5_9GAST|nr:hypothetical protein PoB_003704800 [Plakobranchus ocellatus]